MRSLDDLQRAFEKGLDAWQEEIFLAEAKKIGARAAGEVRRLTPVDTGTLRRRWTARAEKTDGGVVIWIRNNTEYGPAVNYGHRIVRAGKTCGKTKGAHMLENGLYRYKRTMLREDIDRMLTRLREEFR